MRTDILERQEEIEQWIAKHKSKAWICEQFKCKPETLEAWLNKMDIQYRGNRGGKGQKISPRRLTALEYLASPSYKKSHIVRKKLLEDGLKEHQCEVCGTIEWNGEPVPLELDHIDGDHWNWNVHNLRVICPNCHAQTPTNSGKNVGSYN